VSTDHGDFEISGKDAGVKTTTRIYPTAQVAIDTLIARWRAGHVTYRGRGITRELVTNALYAWIGTMPAHKADELIVAGIAILEDAATRPETAVDEPRDLADDAARLRAGGASVVPSKTVRVESDRPKRRSGS
jgi:hypothetical protein